MLINHHIFLISASHRVPLMTNEIVKELSPWLYGLKGPDPDQKVTVMKSTEHQHLHNSQGKRPQKRNEKKKRISMDGHELSHQFIQCTAISNKSSVFCKVKLLKSMQLEV